MQKTTCVLHIYMQYRYCVSIIQVLVVSLMATTWLVCLKVWSSFGVAKSCMLGSGDRLFGGNVFFSNPIIY